MSSTVRLPTTTTTWWIITGCCCCASLVTLVRVGVGYQPHSGQDDYQGPLAAAPPHNRTVYGGDYEAQRHWMELTWHLPLREWYYDDPSYWGLDYPPLTAYHSYVCAGIGQVLFHFTDAFAFQTSRGYEDPLFKAYMRSTVIVSDSLCYGTVVGFFVVAAAAAAAPHRSSFLTPCWHFIYAMIQPAIVLIDHGHFQYNTVALGLSLWSVYFITKRDNSRRAMTNCMIGSVFFCCALSFKQMTLYYAPAIFCYLLGRCFAQAHETDATTASPRDHNITARSYVATIIYRIAALGITVVATLTFLWWPFIFYGPDDTTTIERAQHMFQRIIPIRRGLFEGKVSNLWCALSVSPFRIRQRIPTLYQPVAALLLTLLLLIPSSIHLFNVGRNCHRNNPMNHNHNQAGAHYSYYSFDRQQLLWGMTNSALAFFLASFQVHEKSLLLALAPCSLLLTADPKFVHWFSLVTVWTLWPLLQIDRLQTAYVCTIILFLSMTGLYHELMSLMDSVERPMRAVGFFEYYSRYHFNWIPALGYTVMVLLHVAECVVVVPKHLPDLFPVLWSIVGCGFCCLSYVITFWHMLFNQRTMSTVSTRTDSVIDSIKVKAQ